MWHIRSVCCTQTQIEQVVLGAIERARQAATHISESVSQALRGLLERTAVDSLHLLHGSVAAAAAAGSAPTNAKDVRRSASKLRRSLEQAHAEAIAKQAHSKLVAGHILTLTLSDGFDDAISEIVLNTGVHNIGDDTARFAMAAFVERTGVQFVSGIWVYVAVVQEGGEEKA